MGGWCRDAGSVTFRGPAGLPGQARPGRDCTHAGAGSARLRDQGSRRSSKLIPLKAHNEPIAHPFFGSRAIPPTVSPKFSRAPVFALRPSTVRSGRFRRRPGPAPRLAWLLAVAFAFVQLVVPAYACAASVVPAFGAAAVSGQASEADAPCSQHPADGSLLCFKHCHPDAQSTASPVVSMASMAPGPSEPVALVAPTVNRIQPRANAPGLPPPTSISFCRQLL